MTQTTQSWKTYYERSLSRYEAMNCPADQADRLAREYADDRTALDAMARQAGRS